MIDPESTDEDYYIKIRDSMVKFSSDDWTLHICDYSRPGKVDVHYYCNFESEVFIVFASASKFK
jgi:hypothetical protein